MGRIHRPLTYSDIENETAATPCGSLPMRTPVVRLTERGGRTARRVAEGVDIAEESYWAGLSRDSTAKAMASRLRGAKKLGGSAPLPQQATRSRSSNSAIV